jgi:2-polyprenyl-3-methyl-5-hydroxy-6-metoxy-1,4-benzoquinol methylase
MLQPLDELEQFYRDDDPWGYETNTNDTNRKNIILSEIPDLKYQNVLDIGCGHGFITRSLPGNRITGVDISLNAITQANLRQSQGDNPRNINFIHSSIFDLTDKLSDSYDLILITGVLYPQYIGESKILIYKILDQLLAENGILVCSHINDWYNLRFPYLMIENYYFEYREYTQCLEVYVK